MPVRLIIAVSIQMNDTGEIGWIEYRRLILSELDRVGKEIRAIHEKVDAFRVNDLATIKTDIALLKFQAGLWGAIGGTLFGAVATALLRLWVK